MERRQFLKLGGLSTLGATTPALAAPRDIEEADVDEAIARINASIASMRNRYRRRFQSHPDLTERAELLDAMRTLTGGTFAYQALHEQPIDVQVHPAGQDRITQAMADIVDGSKALRRALGDMDPDEVDALETLWQAHHVNAIDVAGKSYGQFGGTTMGRRRFRRMADTVQRDAKRDGLHHSLQGYLAEIDAVQHRPRPKRKPDPATRARMERAAARWRKKGVDIRPGISSAGRVVAGILGVGLVIGGIALVVIGVAGMASCWCVAIFALLGGVGAIIVGVLLLAMAVQNNMQPAPIGALEGG